MVNAVQPDQQDQRGCSAPSKSAIIRRVVWLQTVTILWMAAEVGVSGFAVLTSHSTAILAFGADSLVELLSAAVVLLQFLPVASMDQRKSARMAGLLLFTLALVIAGLSVSSLLFRVHPAVSRAGIAITVAALIVMPVLAYLKRREGLGLQNAALTADAAQSATCAYLAAVSLVGLAINAEFHLYWADSVAALAAIPLIIKEGRSAWNGESCGCC